ncbi:unnamed protein product, partial [Rotaria sp. Silwood2]
IYQCDKRSDSNLCKHLGSSTHQIPNMLYASQLNKDEIYQGPVILPERV